MTSSADLKERAAVISAGVKLLPMLLTHPPYIPASMKSDELNQRHRLLDMQPDEDGYLFSDVFGHAPGTATRVTSRIQALQQQLEALLGIQPSAASAVKKVVGEVTFSAPEQTFALACVSLGNINSKKPLLDLVLRRAMGVSEDDAERIWKFDNLVPAGTLPGAWVSSLQQAYETHRQEQVRASIARQAGRERNVSVDSTNVPNFDRSYSDRSLGTTRTYNSFATAASSFEEDHIAKSQADASAKPSPGAEYITDPDEFWGGVDDGDDEDSAQDEAQEPATEAPEAEQKAEDDYWARYDLQQPAAEGRRSSVNGEQHGGDIDGVGSTQGLSSAHSANHFSDFLSVGSAIAGAEHRELSLHAAGMSSPVEVHNEPALASGGLTIQALDRHDAKPQQPQWWEIPNGITEREPARPKLGRLSSIRSDATDYGTETLQDHRSQSTHADGISMLPNTSDILPHEDPDVGVEDDEERGIADVVTGEDFALDPIPEAIDHQATDDPYEDEESASPKDSKKDNFGLDTISDKTGGHDFDLDEPASSKATAPDVGQTAQSIVEPDGDALVSQAGPKVMIAKPSRDDLVADSPQAPNDEELEAAEAEDELGAVLSRSRAGSLLPSSPTASLSSVMAPRPPRSVVSVQSSYDTPADMELADLEAFYRARDQKRQEEKRERIRRGGQLPGIDDDENRGVKSPSSHQSPATRERSLSIKDLDPITALGIAPKSARESDQPRKVVRNASMDALRRLAEQQERESNMRWGGVAGSEISRQSSGSKSAQKGGGFGSFLQMAPSEVTDVSSVSFAKEPPLPSPTYLPQVNDPFLPQNESEHQATSTLEAADEVPELSQPNEETNESDQHASALSRGRLQQGEADTTLEHPEGTEARGAPENEAADEQHDLDLTLDDEEATNIGHAIASEMQLDTQEAQRVTKELDKQDLDPQNSQVAIGEDKSDENDAVDDERFNQKELHLPLPEAKSFLPSEAFNLKVRHAIDSPNASEGDSLVRQVTNSMRGHGKGRARVSPGGSSVIAASDSFMPSAASDASVRPLFGSRQGSWPSQTDSPDSGPGKLAARALRPARTRFNLETFQETDFDDGKSISSTQQQLGLDSPSEAPVKPGVGVSSNRSDLDGASNDQSIQSKPVKFRAVGSGPPPSATSAHTANMLHDYLKQQRRQALQSKRDRVVQKQQQRTNSEKQVQDAGYFNIDTYDDRTPMPLERDAQQLASGFADGNEARPTNPRALTSTTSRTSSTLREVDDMMAISREAARNSKSKAEAESLEAREERNVPQDEDEEGEQTGLGLSKNAVQPDESRSVDESLDEDFDDQEAAEIDADPEADRRVFGQESEPVSLELPLDEDEGPVADSGAEDEESDRAAEDAEGFTVNAEQPEGVEDEDESTFEEGFVRPIAGRILDQGDGERTSSWKRLSQSHDVAAGAVLPPSPPSEEESLGSSHDNVRESWVQQDPSMLSTPAIRAGNQADESMLLQPLHPKQSEEFSISPAAATIAEPQEEPRRVSGIGARHQGQLPNGVQESEPMDLHQARSQGAQAARLRRQAAMSIRRRNDAAKAILRGVWDLLEEATAPTEGAQDNDAAGRLTEGEFVRLCREVAREQVARRGEADEADQEQALRPLIKIVKGDGIPNGGDNVVEEDFEE